MNPSFFIEALPNRWQISSPVEEGDYFKVQHLLSNHPLEDFQGIIAQADLVDGELLIYGPTEIRGSVNSEVFNFQKPSCFSSRRLAFKSSLVKPIYLWSWKLNIMPLFGTSNNNQNQNLPASAGNTTTVAASTASVVLLAANTAALNASGSRKGIVITNNSTATLSVSTSATATAASFTVQVPAGYYYEFPFLYTGALSGIWSSANGNAVITEYVI